MVQRKWWLLMDCRRHTLLMNARWVDVELLFFNSIDCVALSLLLIVYIVIVCCSSFIFIIASHSIHHYTLFTLNIIYHHHHPSPHTRCAIKSQVAQHSTPASPRPSSSSCVVARQPWSSGLNVPPRLPPINRCRKLLSQVCCSCSIYTFIYAFLLKFPLFLKIFFIKRLSTRTVVESTANVKCCLCWLRYDNNSWISSMFLKMFKILHSILCFFLAVKAPITVTNVTPQPIVAPAYTQAYTPQPAYNPELNK